MKYITDTDESNEFYGDLLFKLGKTDIISFDVEASSLDPYASTLLLIQIAIPNKESYVINYGKFDRTKIIHLLKIIEERGITVIGHNFKFDIKQILHHCGIFLTNIYDTMYGEVLTKPGLTKPYYKLNELTEKYLGLKLKKDIRKEFVDKTDYDFTEDQIKYSALDVEPLYQIYELQKQIITNEKMNRVLELEMALEPIIARMEYLGISFDKENWLELSRQAQEKAEEYERRLYRYIADNFNKIVDNPVNASEAIEQLNITQTVDGYSVNAKKRQKIYKDITVKEEIINTTIPMLNFASPKQVINILQKLGIDTDSSSEKELQRYKNYEFVDTLLKYRDYYKSGHAFGENFLEYVNKETNKIHTELGQLIAVTGRFGSAGPNLQNIKADKEYRASFIASKNYFLVTADYSQIELRLMAQAAMEPLMIDAFINEEDLHRLTASIIFDARPEDVTDEQRQIGKSLNFAVIYGTSEYGLRYNFGWTLDRGKEYLDKYFGRYTRIKQFQDRVGNLVLRNAYSTTHLGRKRYFTIPRGLYGWKAKKIYGRIKRQGINQIIQGDAAEIIKFSLINLGQNPFGWDKFRPLLTIHDENVVEVASDFVYYDHENDKYNLIPEVFEFFDDAMIKAGQPFLKDIPVVYDYTVDKIWKK